MEGKYRLKRNDLIYPDLSFKINGVLFQVSNQLGGGHKESYYQKATAIALKQAGLKFNEQVYVPVKFHNKLIGKYFLDFLIEDKIVLELKRDKFVPHSIISQTKQYTEVLNKKLALIACFTHKGVAIKRIINHNYNNS